MAFPLESLLATRFVVFTLVLARISGLVMIAPVFSSTAMPLRVRGLLAMALSLVILPAVIATPLGDPGNLVQYVVLLAGELLVGLAIGLALLILYAGVQIAGQIIGQLSGMALADVFDPAFDANTPIFAQLLFFVTIAIFLLVGGHRLVMGALLDTFGAMPPGSAGVTESVVRTLVDMLSLSFSCGIRAAAPVMTALLLATFVLGLISRTLPQLNIIAVGFGLNSLVTLGILMLSIGGITWVFAEQVAGVVDAVVGAMVEE